MLIDHPAASGSTFRSDEHDAGHCCSLTTDRPGGQASLDAIPRVSFDCLPASQPRMQAAVVDHVRASYDMGYLVQ